MESPEPLRVKPGAGADSARLGTREVYFDETGFSEVPIYDRLLLGEGDSLQGPAIIEEPGSTTLIPPLGHCGVDEWGNLRIFLPGLSKTTVSTPVSSQRCVIPMPPVSFMRAPR